MATLWRQTWWWPTGRPRRHAVARQPIVAVAAAASSGTAARAVLSVPEQAASPDGDVHTGGWQNEVGGTTGLWQSIDEPTIDDGDWVRSPALTPAGQAVYVHSLEAVSDPQVSAGHILRYRYDREDVSGAPTVDYTIQLRQGYVSEAAQGTLIAQAVHAGIGDALVTGQLTLSAGEADAITNYAALAVRHVVTAV